MEVANMVISDASNKLTRREIGERLCMIICSFVSSDRRRDQLVWLWKLDVALLRAFDHFHLGTWSWLRSWGCCLNWFRRCGYSANRLRFTLRLLTLERTRLGSLRRLFTTQQTALVDAWCLFVTLIDLAAHHELEFAFARGEGQFLCLLRRDLKRQIGRASCRER